MSRLSRLLETGLRSLRGPKPVLPGGWLVFTRVVLRALRPHFFVLPAGAALAGAASLGGALTSWRVGVVTVSAGVGWGVGQLLNDLLDVEADAVDAPSRPAVTGELPVGPALLVAAGLGVSFAAACSALHPQAVWVTLAATVLLLTYGSAKALPLAGNVAHGMLISAVSVLGALAAAPERSLADVLGRSWPVASLAGAWAALYLEANYEKDGPGDRAAGYRTLPILLGLRASATLRALAYAGLALFAFGPAGIMGPVRQLAFGVALLLVLASALLVALFPSTPSALRAYRPALHGSALGMLALAAPALGQLGLLVAAIASATLIERAFARSANP